MNPPLVSLIVPCRNERASIEGALRSILEQETPGGDFEIIVADGMSDDGTRPVLERMAKENPRIRVIDNPGRIVSTGLNAAIAAARGQILLRFDAHTGYARDYVRRCLEVLDETGADNVGGPWVARGETLIGRAIAAAFQSPFAVGWARGHDPGYEGPVDSVYLGCWRRAIFDRIGLFDESLVRNQDDEWNLRLTRAGGRIWQSPRIRSEYSVRESLPALFRQYLQYGYWKVGVIRKHRLPASPRHLVPGLFLAALLALGVAGVFWMPAAKAAAILLAVYALALLAAALRTASRAGWALFPVLPLVFACYHFGYGLGFLAGLLSRPRAEGRFSKLTREPVAPGLASEKGRSA